MKRPLIVLLFLTVVLAVSPALAAPVTESVDQPAAVYLSETASGCSNNPGPFITLTGELKLGGVNARIILTNNAKFTHVAKQDVFVDVPILDAGEEITIAKQPPEGGAGGNPWIYIQFKDGYGEEVSDPILLGRCVQGLNNTALDFDMLTDIDMDVDSDVCTNHPGPFIRLNGELRLGGLEATLIFTNNRKFRHVAEEDVTVDFVLIPAGTTYTFHKQPPLGGAGGNPWVYVQFLDGSGDELSDPILLGRCNKL
jgi:hypothetical protein